MSTGSGLPPSGATPGMPPGPGAHKGTFLANVRGGAVQFPPPIRKFCLSRGWTLFQMLMLDDDRLELDPVLPGEETDITGQYHSSLSEEGELWIPQAIRDTVALGEQSVMMRIEDGIIRIYLRKVFQTLGFGP